MHSSTSAQPISSFQTNPRTPDPLYLFPDGSTHRDLGDYVEQIQAVYLSAVHQLEPHQANKLIKFIGANPHPSIVKPIMGVGVYAYFYLCMSRTLGSNELVFNIAKPHIPPTTAQQVAAKLSSQTTPDFVLIPPAEVIRDLLPHAIWRCSELSACEFFEGGIDVKIEQAVGVHREQIQRRERF